MTLDGMRRCATAPRKMADSLAVARWSNQWTHDPIYLPIQRAGDRIETGRQGLGGRAVGRQSAFGRRETHGRPSLTCTNSTQLVLCS